MRIYIYMVWKVANALEKLPKVHLASKAAVKYPDSEEKECKETKSRNIILLFTYVFVFQVLTGVLMLY